MKKILALILVVVLFVGCGDKQETVTGGQVTFRFEMTDKDGEVTDWSVTTTQTILSDALIEEGLIEGEEGEYGLFVKSVNGVVIEEDNAYWELFVDGESSMIGVSSVEVEQGMTYAFIYSTF